MIRYGDLSTAYSNRNKSRIVIVPVPYDGTSTWIRGSARGPAAILDASRNLELYDIETGTEVYRKGIHTDEPVKVPDAAELMVHEVQKNVSQWLTLGKFVVTVGGEHSITIGAVSAHVKKFPKISVLQLDAHADLRPEYQGSSYNHACTMARVRELCPITQVGIRSMDAEEMKYIEPDRVFYQEKIIHQNNWMDRVIETLAKQVYLTVDLDVLDPSVMPSTGTPEPGGMDWYSLLELIRKVTMNSELVGFDIMELCPSKQNRAPDFLAAKLIYKILGYRFNI